MLASLWLSWIMLKERNARFFKERIRSANGIWDTTTFAVHRFFIQLIGSWFIQSKGVVDKAYKLNPYRDLK